MSEPTAEFSDLVLTPHGLLLLEPAPGASAWGDTQAATRVAGALATGSGAGLLDLGTCELGVVLPHAHDGRAACPTTPLEA